jgi:hypothetical protein
VSADNFLKQYQTINAEINQLEKQLLDLADAGYEYGVSGVEGSSKSIPYAKHNILVAGYGRSERVQAQIKVLGKTYEDKLLRLYASRRDVETMLDGITDGKARVIIRYRYIDGLTWQQIADKLGGNNTEESTKKYCQRVLQNL